MISKTLGAVLQGVNASIVSVEVTIVQGTKLYIVGLPDSSIKESQHRIESVLKHTKYYMPRRRVIVNLAPADIKKEGSAYDLPIALCMLQSSNQCVFNNLDKYMVMGELSLDGYLRPIKGVLSMAMEAKKVNVKGFIIPKENALEAAVVSGLNVVPVHTIQEAIDHLRGRKLISFVKKKPSHIVEKIQNKYKDDFSDVKGQESVKRALEVAAAGGHNVLMIGPPGSGKTMLAKRLVTILPPMTLEESLETTKVYSALGKLKPEQALVTRRPLRAPHHTTSDVALVGGGSVPQPGEMSLANNGILFLDELPEFKRSVLEVMRQPLEDKCVMISRSQTSLVFPTNFMLITSMNPCPCGYYSYIREKCICSSSTIQRYISKISGPLLDRIDLHIEVLPVSFNKIITTQPVEESQKILKRVIKARDKQLSRFSSIVGIYNNAMMTPTLAKKVCVLNKKCQEVLSKAVKKLGLSARAYDRILKVARTIADLDEKQSIEINHLAEAIHYRSLDRDNWAKN